MGKCWYVFLGDDVCLVPWEAYLRGSAAAQSGDKGWAAVRKPRWRRGGSGAGGRRVAQPSPVCPSFRLVLAQRHCFAHHLLPPSDVLFRTYTILHKCCLCDCQHCQVNWHMCTFSDAVNVELFVKMQLHHQNK